MYIAIKKRDAFLIFISGHGYGHISRMSHVLRRLNLIYNNFQSHTSPYFIIISTANPKFIKNLKLKNTVLINIQHDVGLIQYDSFTVDFNKTLFELNKIEKTTSNIKSKIFNSIKDYTINAVLSDTSPFAFSIAKKLCVKSFFIGNFTWVDIYKDIAQIENGFDYYAKKLSYEYKKADESLVLPMHTKMEPFTRKTFIPFIATKKSNMTKFHFEKITKIKMNDSRKIILLSFGGFDFHNFPIEKLKKYADKYIFLTTKAKITNNFENLINVDTYCSDYQGLIKFSDAVITKPGYGIITDCLTHKKPIIFTDRGRFAEYPVLVKWLNDFFPSYYIPQNDIFNGNLDNALDSIFKISCNFPDFALNGADITARKLIKANI